MSTSKSESCRNRNRNETDDTDNNYIHNNDNNQIMLETHQMVKGLNRKFDTLQKSVHELKKDNAFFEE